MSEDEVEVLYSRYGSEGPGPALPGLDELEFLCAFELYFIVDSQVRAVYLHRSPTADEAWSVDLDCAFDPGERPYGEAVLERLRAGEAKLTCDVALRPQGGRRRRMLRMLEWEIGHCGLGGGAEEFVAAGSASRRDYLRLLRLDEGRCRRRAAVERKQRPPIVDTAEELKLYPRPSGG